MANPGPNIEQSVMTLAALAPGTGLVPLPFELVLANVVDATDFITAYPMRHRGRLMAVDWITHAKVTSSGKAATLTPKIRRGTTTTAVTGGVLALTSALATPEGTVIAGTPITGGNTFVPGDALTASWTGVTAFVEGTGTLIFWIINDDTIGAISRDQGLFSP